MVLAGPANATNHLITRQESTKFILGVIIKINFSIKLYIQNLKVVCLFNEIDYL